jgi:ankyrin repeat protein
MTLFSVFRTRAILGAVLAVSLFAQSSMAMQKSGGGLPASIDPNMLRAGVAIAALVSQFATIAEGIGQLLPWVSQHHAFEQSLSPGTRESEYHRAVRSGDAQRVVNVVRRWNGYGIDHVSVAGLTALELAIVMHGDDTAVLEALLDGRANPDRRTRDNDETSSLELAVRHEHLAVARLLLEAGASTTIRDADGNSAFTTAVEHNQTRMVELFIEEEARRAAQMIPFRQRTTTAQSSLSRIPLQVRENTYTMLHHGLLSGALHIAAQQNLPDMVSLILRYDVGGTLLNERAATAQGETPLMVAARHGSSLAAASLLTAGADRSATDRNGDHMLHYAVRHQQAAFMLEFRAELMPLANVANRDGVTPLLASASIHRHLNFRRPTSVLHDARRAITNELLLNMDADTSVVDARGRNYWHHHLLGIDISHSGQYDIDWLDDARERYGYQVDAVDFDGANELVIAASQTGYPTALRYLMELPENLSEAGDHLGRSALHRALDAGNSLAVDMLMGRFPAMVNEVDGEQRTPVMRALRLGLPFSRVLANAPELDINVVDQLGMNAAHHAAAMNNREALRELLRRFPEARGTRTTAGLTVLHIALAHGHDDLAFELSHNNPHISDADSSGHTPHQYALLFGDEGVAAAIAARTRTANTDEHGHSPSRDAVRSDSSGCFSRALGHIGAGVNYLLRAVGLGGGR